MIDETQRALLEQAVENFRPERSLHTKDDFDRFYVERPLTTIAELSEQVRLATSATKFLVYGHRGCGKTSELNRLARELKDTHFTVVLSLEDENDPSDLHYTELLTSLCRSLLYTAKRRGLEVSDALLTDVLAWFADVEDITERKLSAEGSLTEKVSVYFVELFSKQSAEFSKRQERRQKRERREGQLLDLINRFIQEIKAADTRRVGHARPLFAIIDSLDRCRPEVAREVFKYTQALRAPQMTMIYTVPLALAQDTAAFSIFQDFGNYDCTIPVLTLVTLEGQRDELAWTLTYAIVQRRSQGAELPYSVRDRLIQGSGGVLSILFWLFYNVYALILARQVALQDEQTLNEIANRVLTQQRERFKRGLMERDYEVLSQRLPSPFPKRDEQFQKLLYANCILQYSNGVGESWYDMHPLVRTLVDQWHVARETDSQGT